MVMEIKMGDIVRLRKVHPCGSFDWRVVRLGADIGIRCVKCQRRVLLERPIFERRVKHLISRESPQRTALSPLISDEKPDVIE